MTCAGRSRSRSLARPVSARTRRTSPGGDVLAITPRLMWPLTRMPAGRLAGTRAIVVARPRASASMAQLCPYVNRIDLNRVSSRPRQAHLACALSEGGAAVALVDNDEQGSSSLWAGAGKLPVRCLHLPLLRAEGFAPWMRQLVELRAGHDILVVDFPAGVAPALAATLLMSSAVLVPCTPSGIEVAATRRMTRHLARLRAERPADPPAVMIVPTRVGEGG